MKRRRKKYKPLEGNIEKNDPYYDPFPKTGPIKDYEPLIRDRVVKFCKLYPHARPANVLNEAVLLAQKALDKFDPARGWKFGTLLILYLRGLPKMFEEERGWSHSDPSLELGEQEPSPALIIPPGGANGTRVWLDWWKFAGCDGIFVRDVRTGLKIGFQLYDRSESYAKDASARISAALRAFDDMNIRDDVVLGRLRAALDHAERRAREEQQEAEDRARGDYSPTFLEVRQTAFVMKPYEAKTPRQSPRMANIRNSEGEYDKRTRGEYDKNNREGEHDNKYAEKSRGDNRGSWEETWHLSLGNILYPGGVLTPGSNRGRLVRHISGKWVELNRWRVDRAIAFLRPTLTKNEAAVMDGIVVELNNSAFPVEQVSAQIGIQERGTYKIRERLIRRIHERVTAVNRQWNRDGTTPPGMENS
jgi:hypothetical protein